MQVVCFRLFFFSEHHGGVAILTHAHHKEVHGLAKQTRAALVVSLLRQEVGWIINVTFNRRSVRQCWPTGSSRVRIAQRNTHP